jgi:glutathione peroxidase
MMTLRQKIAKALYPLIMRLTKKTNKGLHQASPGQAAPAQPFYSLTALRNNGQPLDLGQFKNKKVLLVNTASNCGFTRQFEELQQLHEQYRDSLVILGFPANDFKEQEKGSDADIAQFCQVNFGVTFPLMQKSQVVKGPGQHPVYQWLTDATRNGWNDHQPDWNFSKYLVDRQGRLSHYFGPSVSPLSPQVLEAVK